MHRHYSLFRWWRKRPNYFPANLFIVLCTKFYQNWPSFVEKFWLTLLWDIAYISLATAVFKDSSRTFKGLKSLIYLLNSRFSRISHATFEPYIQSINDWSLHQWSSPSGSSSWKLSTWCSEGQPVPFCPVQSVPQFLQWHRSELHSSILHWALHRNHSVCTNIRIYRHIYTVFQTSSSAAAERPCYRVH